MISFPKRMLIAVSMILLLADLVIFARAYWFKDLSLGLVLIVSIMEILAIAVNFVYWVPKYKLKW